MSHTPAVFCQTKCPTKVCNEAAFFKAAHAKLVKAHLPKKPKRMHNHDVFHTPIPFHPENDTLAPVDTADIFDR